MRKIDMLSAMPFSEIIAYVVLGILMGLALCYSWTLNPFLFAGIIGGILGLNAAVAGGNEDKD